MAVMKQKNIRQAEKSLKDLLDKADNNANGKVELTDFLKILEANGVEVSVTVTDFSKIYSISCTECFSRKETSATQFKVWWKIKENIFSKSEITSYKLIVAWNK